MKGIYTIEDIEKDIAFYSGYVLIGLNFTLRDDGWLMIVKVRGRSGKPLVSFIHANTPALCFEQLKLALTTTHFTLKWREDKFQKS